MGQIVTINDLDRDMCARTLQYSEWVHFGRCVTSFGETSDGFFQRCRQSGQARLLDRVAEAVRVRHLSRSTEKTYVYWTRRFILYHGKRHPLEMGKTEVENFLTHLAVDCHVSASTQNQAFSALLFLYRHVLKRDFGWLEDVVRAKRSDRIPTVFTHAEATAILRRLRGVNWLIGKLLYGGGLRGIEALRLRVKDLQFDRLQIKVRDAKGQKDRITILPKTVVEPLKEHLIPVQRAHEQATGTAAWSCQTHWLASIPAPPLNGRGSTSFPHPSRRLILVAGPNGGTTE